MEKSARIVLSDGTVFRGTAFGAERPAQDPVVGELIFNTAMYGYQEIITDPSYAGQIMCFTSPHIGNVGVNIDDGESGRIWTEAVIVRNLSKTVSNYRATQSLPAYLKSQGIMGVSGVNTRALTLYLRDHGAQAAAIAVGDESNIAELQSAAQSFGSMAGKDFCATVMGSKPAHWTESIFNLAKNRYDDVGDSVDGRPHIVALDFGLKRNIVRLFVHYGARVTVVPGTASVEEVLALSPDGVFLSNGPGDPATLLDAVHTVAGLLGKVPIFGICLGHQILALAAGAKTYKLKFGHRGGNHPILDLDTKKVEITAQNHGFAVAAEGLPESLRVTHVNLNDRTIAGIEIVGKDAFSVQYHPEASSGPHDSRYLFERFFAVIEASSYRLGSKRDSHECSESVLSCVGE